MILSAKAKVVESMRSSVKTRGVLSIQTVRLVLLVARFGLGIILFATTGALAVMMIGLARESSEFRTLFLLTTLALFFAAQAWAVWFILLFRRSKPPGDSGPYFPPPEDPPEPADGPRVPRPPRTQPPLLLSAKAGTADAGRPDVPQQSVMRK